MLTLPPVKGEISLAGVFPFAGVGGSARTRVIVVVVVEYIIILIIISTTTTTILAGGRSAYNREGKHTR